MEIIAGYSSIPGSFEMVCTVVDEEDSKSFPAPPTAVGADESSPERRRRRLFVFCRHQRGAYRSWDPLSWPRQLQRPTRRAAAVMRLSSSDKSRGVVVARVSLEEQRDEKLLCGGLVFSFRRRRRSRLG